MSSQEILTLQFGTYSNFVGTHFWNLQQKHLNSILYNEELCSLQHDKLFRESYKGNTQNYVPRMICFDVKKSLKTLNEDGTFHSEEDESKEVNNGDHVTYAQETIQKNEFITQMSSDRPVQSNLNVNLDDTITTWTDYMMSCLNDNSIQLMRYNYNDGDEFNYFGLGQQEYNNLQDNIEEKLHYWVEECNSIEGFQLSTDMHNGYCGIASKTLEDLHDEYNKKCCLAYINWPTIPATNLYQDLNIALTFQSFKEHSSLFVLQSTQNSLFARNPENVLIQNVTYKSNLLYHTSAILAATLDSTTLPWRQCQRSVSMPELCHHISQGKWKLAGTAIGFPSFRKELTLFDQMLSMDGFYNQLTTGLCPGVNVSDMVPLGQSVLLRNIPENLVLPANIHSGMLQKLGLNRNIFFNNPSSMLEFFCERFYPCENTVSKSYYANTKLDVKTPFPMLINPCEDCDREDVSVMSSLFTSARLYDLLHAVIKRIVNINLNKFHVVQEFGLDYDTMKELQEDLIDLAREYDHVKAFHEF